MNEPEKAQHDDRLDAALAREHLLWEAFRRRDTDALEQLIAGDVQDVGAAGVLDRDRIIAAVLRMQIAAYSFREASLRVLGDVEVVTYRSTVDGTYSGKPFTSRDVLNTSVWRRDERGWRLVHRQETPSRAAS